MGTRATSTSNTVNVILRVVWIIVVQNMSNVANIFYNQGKKHTNMLAEITRRNKHSPST